MFANGYQNIFKIPELKRRILFTLSMLRFTVSAS